MDGDFTFYVPISRRVSPECLLGLFSDYELTMAPIQFMMTHMIAWPYLLWFSRRTRLFSAFPKNAGFSDIFMTHGTLYT